MSLLVALPVLVVVTLVMAVFLWIGTSVAGIEGRSYTKAVVATAIDMVASVALGTVLHLVGLEGGFIGGAGAVILSFFVIKSVFATGWLQAAAAWFIQLIAILVVSIPLAVLFGAALLQAAR